ncbi:unnamed protein product [Paramecium sonneborni]|uniref:ERV/ALR sulfhydryl oxidase domain-containing protein n=1 Tax=Paramecium sonneborni TaxID=65129 RepID=A0A8S1R8H1_9CILI|nr:unnamed protein product [Paramecium sonneborni]
MSDKNCFEPICEKEDILNFKSKKRSKLQFEDEQPIQECPLNRSTYGNYTWNMLHTTAIYYPDEPTLEQQQKMRNLFDAIAEFYACKHCKAHFQKDISKNPPQVTSRKDLSIWLCYRHNEVNQLLGKPQFDCSFENLEKRWRTGCQ